MTEAELLRENAELKEQNDQICELNLKVTASNARLRRALGSLRANVHGGIAVSDRHTLIDAMCLTNLRCIERELAEAEKVLDETPEQSLAAITAPLKAKIARLREALRKRVAAKVKKCKCKDCDELRNILAETPAESLAAIRDAALKDDALWGQHAVRCGNCDCEMIVRKGHALSDPDGSEDEALCGRCAGAQMYIYMDRIDELESEEHRKKFQDAARAEERKRYDELVDALCSPSWLGRNRHESVLALATRLRNQQLEIRTNSGEEKKQK